MERKENLSEQVYRQLFQMILKGDYKVGDRLPGENELKERFQCSRNTIRGAIKRLDVLGIVETKQGGGTYLKNIGTNAYLNAFIPSMLIGADDLMNLMMFRRGIEIVAARLAAMKATEEDIHKMQAYFDYVDGKEISTDDYAYATSSFHYQIAEASKNDILKSMLEIINWIITSKMADFQAFRKDNAESLYYHRMVFMCIKNHEPDEAAYMMDRHMEMLIQRVVAYIEYKKQQNEKIQEELCETKS